MPTHSRQSSMIITFNNIYHYPPITGEVEGLKIGAGTPNVRSIGASFTNYEILEGTRQIPTADFDCDPKHLFSAKDDIESCFRLARDISSNQEIDPLIVVIDADGPYVLEGAHRLGALGILKKRSFPALVVLDKD